MLGLIFDNKLFFLPHIKMPMHRFNSIQYFKTSIEYKQVAIMH